MTATPRRAPGGGLLRVTEGRAGVVTDSTKSIYGKCLLQGAKDKASASHLMDRHSTALDGPATYKAVDGATWFSTSWPNASFVSVFVMADLSTANGVRAAYLALDYATTAGPGRGTTPALRSPGW